MVEALLLVIVWIGGWMVIAGFRLGDGWFVIWSITLAMVAWADVRRHLAAKRGRKALLKPGIAEPVLDSDSVDGEEAPVALVNNSATSSAARNAVASPLSESGRFGGAPFKFDRDVVGSAAQSNSTPSSPIPPPHASDSASSGPCGTPIRSESKIATRTEGPTPPVWLAGGQPSAQVVAAQAPQKVLDQYSKERFPARSLTPETPMGRESAPAPPATPQFEKPKTPVVIISETPANLPQQPVRPLGPAAETPRTRPPISTPTAPRAPREPRAILRPEDFQQNARVRGYLYLARNDEHWEGLHKVGQTREPPRGRVALLNKQHQEFTDIGEFELLDFVPVVDAYGAEQVLFQVLKDLRPVDKREFFIAKSSYLSDAMQAAAQFFVGDVEWLNRIYREVNRNDHPEWPRYPYRYTHHSVGRSPGWLFVARNRFHKADTYRVSASVKRPNEIVEKWNEFQRTATSQIGFYEVVFSLPVANYTKAGAIGRGALKRWKLRGQSFFFRGPLEEIAATLESALQAATEHRV